MDSPKIEKIEKVEFDPKTPEKQVRTPTKLETSSLHRKLNTYVCGETSIVNNINLLIIGEKGSGKSSLISTFHRALANNYGEKPIADVGTSLTSVFCDQFIH